MNLKLGFREDVQILRGIAVLLVVLFHLNVPGFSNGFLGVDVFFVVSGYLMFALFTPGSVATFYQSRIRRLIPAYACTVLATLILGFVLTNPMDFHQIVNQTAFAVVFSSNVGFWFENSYFDKSAFKPLLHLWSLGVEMQFYALLPAIHWLCKRNAIVAPIIAMMSLCLCAYAVGISPKTAFFLLPFRLWEFLFGFIVAQSSLQRVREQGLLAAVVPWASLLGLGLIQLLPIEGNSGDFLFGHPAAPAFAVCSCTAFILRYGLPAIVEEHSVGKVLARLGNWSYSIYLVHFPLIVLVLYRPFAGTVTRPNDLFVTISLIASIAIGAAVLYRHVESPLRHRPEIPRISIPTLAAIGAFAYALVSIQPVLFPENELKIFNAWFDRDVYRCGKLIRIIDRSSRSCEITKLASPPQASILLVGNSHADSIKRTFSDAAAERGVAVYFLVQNIPMMDGGLSLDEVISEAKKVGAATIVLHYSPGALSPALITRFVEMTRINRIAASFVMPVPMWPTHVPESLWRSVEHGYPLPRMSIGDYASQNHELISALNGMPKGAMRVYEIADKFCGPHCTMTSPAGSPLYFDAGHLTLQGSNRLRSVFQRVVDDALSDSVSVGRS